MIISKLIDDSLIELGVLNPREEATPEEHEHALRIFNRILDLINKQSLFYPVLKDVTITKPDTGWKSHLTLSGCLPNKVNTSPAYTKECYNVKDFESSFSSDNKIKYLLSQCIGDISVKAPSFVDGAFVRLSESDTFMEKFTIEEYYNIQFKNNIGIPTKFAYQRDDLLGHIYFNLIPCDMCEIHLLAKIPRKGKYISFDYEFSPADDLYFSESLEHYIVLKLAIELADSYGVSVSQLLTERYKEAQDILKSYNYKPKVLNNSWARRRYWSVTGKYR